MPTRPPAKSSYSRLLRDIKFALSKGIVSVQKALEYQRVKTYWTVGRRITEEVEKSEGTLELNDNLYQRISEDIRLSMKLELTRDTIQRSIQFYRNYPKFPERTPLTFTHYLALMRLADSEERAKLEKEAVQKRITAYELKKRIGSVNPDTVELLAPSATALKVERGEPYIYYVRSFPDLKNQLHVCLDLGFKIHMPVKSGLFSRPIRLSSDKGRYVRSVKTNGIYELRRAPRKWNKIYTYAASPYRVVDGDTFDALVDAGFGVYIRERFRLKGIDAPEIKTQAGRKAREFLKSYFSTCKSIVIRTAKAEMYGRWLGDVFALPGSNDPIAIATQGKYINQLMLDEGLAAGYG